MQVCDAAAWIAQNESSHTTIDALWCAIDCNAAHSAEPADRAQPQHTPTASRSVVCHSARSVPHCIAARLGHRTYAKIGEARLRALKQADQLPIFSTDESMAICELMYGSLPSGPTDSCTHARTHTTCPTRRASLARYGSPSCATSWLPRGPHRLRSRAKPTRTIAPMGCSACVAGAHAAWYA